MNNYKNILLLSDMDGTLLNSKGEITEQNKQAIKTFVGRGGRFGVATGRTQLNSVPYIQDLDVNAPCILYNGCALYDFTENKFLSLHTLKKTNLVEYLVLCLQVFEKDVMIQIYSANMCYIVTPQIYADTEELKKHEPYIFCKLDDILEEDWIKILICGSSIDIKCMEQKIYHYGLEEDIKWVFSSNIYMEFLPKNINKGSMLTELREKLGGVYKIYAVGDYHNDMEMLAAADVGIAPENALPCLKEIADVITVNNDESAIADVINHFIE